MTHRLPMRIRGGLLVLLTLGLVWTLAATTTASASDTTPTRTPLASTNGTIVAIADGSVVTANPVADQAHLVAHEGDFPRRFVSVSMDNNGVIYAVNADRVYRLTQSGDLLGSWEPSNPGQGQPFGGISDSEVRRDGSRIMTQSIWSNCNGGGITAICNVREITPIGSTSTQGTLTNRNNAWWMGNTNVLAVNGATSYYRLGDANPSDWFEDEDLIQWDARGSVSADGKVLGLGALTCVPDGDGCDYQYAISLYRVSAAPPAVPSLACRVFVDDLIGDDIQVVNLALSPTGNAFAFTDSDDDLFLVSNVNLSNCNFGDVTHLGEDIGHIYWGAADYDPDGGTTGPGDPDPEDPEGAFDDVPGNHLFATEIEWLADTGITKGCNPPHNTRFCPNDRVTRGQMAAFLVRALGLPAAGNQGFTDTANSVFAKDINALAAAGITRGCNPPANNRFCPNDTVTRGQMAAFLTRALGLPAATSQGFTDTASSVFARDIDAFANAGVTRGCNPPTNNRYCPNDPVTRGQMAAFLHRALR